MHPVLLIFTDAAQARAPVSGDFVRYRSAVQSIFYSHREDERMKQPYSWKLVIIMRWHEFCFAKRCAVQCICKRPTWRDRLPVVQSSMCMLTACDAFEPANTLQDSLPPNHFRRHNEVKYKPKPKPDFVAYWNESGAKHRCKVKRRFYQNIVMVTGHPQFIVQQLSMVFVCVCLCVCVGALMYVYVLWCPHGIHEQPELMFRHKKMAARLEDAVKDLKNFNSILKETQKKLAAQREETASSKSENALIGECDKLLKVRLGTCRRLLPHNSQYLLHVGGLAYLRTCVEVTEGNSLGALLILRLLSRSVQCTTVP